MAEKQTRRASLIGSLQMLGRNALGTRYTRQSNEDDKNISRNDNHKATRVFSLSRTVTPFQRNKQQFPSSEEVLSSQENETVKSSRHFSLPLPVKRPPSGIPDESNHGFKSIKTLNGKTKIRIRRLASKSQGPSPSSSDEVSSSSANSSRTFKVSSKPLQSRLPTPSKPPAGDAYSQAVYQKEGRRSVLSSLSRPFTSLRRAVEKDNNNRNEERDTNLVQPCGKYQETKQSANQFGWVTAPIHVVSQGQPMNEVPNVALPKNSAGLSSKRRAHTIIPMPTSESIPSFNVVRSTSLRRPAPRKTINRSLTQQNIASSSVQQVKTPEELQPVQIEEFVGRIPGLLPGHSKRLRKVRVGSINTAPLQQLSHYHSTKKQACTDKAADTMLRSRDTMASTSNFQWKNRFEVLASIEKEGSPEKEQSPGKEDSPNQTHFTNQSSNHTMSSDHEGSSRRKDRTARMVPKTESTTPTRIPCPKNQTLTTPPRGVRQVSEFQPRQYWLGRFVTLINAFHHEDSFNEPDISTGFGMLSSYSRPLVQPPGVDLSSYRVKRAFMVLENVCVTEEASMSLDVFRDEYIRIHGSRWMN